MGEQDQAPLQPNWTALLSPREQATIAHARAYAADYPDSGVPGHSQFLLIAKLAQTIDELEARPKVRAITYDEASRCWRDPITGVKVDL